MIPWRTILVMTAAMLSLASCSSDPQWADPEAHEKTELLRERYTPLIVGTWHMEHVTDKIRYFERLTFQDGGTLSGMRIWQTRQLATIDGEQRYTDWEDVEQLNGTFSGTWKLQWVRDDNGVGQDIINLYASFDNPENEFVAFSQSAPFNLAGDNILRFNNFPYKNNGVWTEYQKGDAEPNF